MKELLDVVTRIYEYRRPYPALVGTASGLETVRLGSIANPWYPRHPRRAASIVAMLIFFICIIASKARFALPPPAATASVRARGVICQERPQRSSHQPH